MHAIPPARRTRVGLPQVLTCRARISAAALLTLAALGPALTASPLAAANLAADTAPRPNIVFFLVDDLGRSDVGFMGGKDIQTPHIDRLAHGGAILDAHYVQPVCSPTRAALLTGRYATGTGVYTVVRPHARWGLPLGERTLAGALKDAGYATAIVGKWHLGEFEPGYLPTARGFDHHYGHYFGALDYFTHLRDGVHDWHRDGRTSNDEGYSTHLIAREACRLIRERDASKPLFLYVPFNGVHAPLQVPDHYLAPYAALRGNRRLLAGMLAAVDEAIGQIVAALDAAGLRPNTLILFSSDNGGPNPAALSTNGGLRAGKGTLYEGGVRVCAFAHWPGRIPAGVTVRHPMHIVDWFPTLVRLAGGSLLQERPLHGRDVWPMLTQDAPSPHPAILLVQSPTRAAVRMGDWKLLRRTPASGTEPPLSTPAKKRKARAAKAAAQEPGLELFHLATDPGETNNLAAREPERAAALGVQLDALLKNAAPPGNLGLQNPTAAHRPRERL
ncbi:MAG: arylsulfatase [Verrucomicrobia bacterium]|nr:arylsulfatase [Verrucomicrobiota bacterium]